MAEGPSPRERIIIGQVLQPSGIRGEVKVKSLTDFPERFHSLRRVFLVEKGEPGRARCLEVESAREQGGNWVLKFAGVGDRSAAETLAGATLEVEAEEAAPLPQGKYYVFDIVGLEVVTDRERSVGRVKEVLRLPPHDLYVVEDSQGRETMVPAVEAIVTRIDLAARQMVIRPPEGLFPDDAD
jgi:16S rRNA processing protein RimM